MTDQEILNNAPKGVFTAMYNNYSSEWFYSNQSNLRSLADIKRIVELKGILSKCERVIQVPNNENTMKDYDLKP